MGLAVRQDCQKVRRRKRFSMRFWWWCKQEYDEHLKHEYEHVECMHLDQKMSESEEASEYVCSEDESSQTDGFVEGLIEARMGVHEGEMAGPSVESGSEAYREMQKKYKVLEASVDRVLALAHTPEVGSSNQTSPSESVGIAMVSASEGVDIRVGVPLGNRNTLTEAKLVELRTDYSVPSYVGLRLPSAADVVRYPPDGSVMIFIDMYQHGLRLPFHPWV
ncbi:unnamed protein product [Prunus armeniaca]